MSNEIICRHAIIGEQASLETRNCFSTGVIIHIIGRQTLGPGRQGAVQILNTEPTIDWVLLGSGESNKGKDCGSLYLQLVDRTHLASWQEKFVIIRITVIQSQGRRITWKLEVKHTVWAAKLAS